VEGEDRSCYIDNNDDDDDNGERGMGGRDVTAAC